MLQPSKQIYDEHVTGSSFSKCCMDVLMLENQMLIGFFFPLPFNFSLSSGFIGRSVSCVFIGRSVKFVTPRQ